MRPSTAMLLLAVLTATAAAAPSPPTGTARPPPPQDTMAQRLQACTMCHGAEGRATPEGYHPRIAGKPAAYLEAQLRHFRDGNRPHAVMAALMAPLTDDYLREIARHFATLSLPYPAPPPSRATPAQRQRAQQLVRQGDPSLGLPACAQCHGQALAGREPAVPGLLGLPADYLAGQLGAWRTGLRRATQPDCMAQVARRLTDQDVAAVALWIGAQPVPTGATPEPAQPAPAGWACGRPP